MLAARWRRVVPSSSIGAATASRDKLRSKEASCLCVCVCVYVCVCVCVSESARSGGEGELKLRHRTFVEKLLVFSFQNGLLYRLTLVHFVKMQGSPL